MHYSLFAVVTRIVVVSLSLQPFENPYATPEGIVFDLDHILTYIKKHGVSPVTGKVELNVLYSNTFNLLAVIIAGPRRQGSYKNRISQEFRW